MIAGTRSSASFSGASVSATTTSELVQKKTALKIDVQKNFVDFRHDILLCFSI